MSYPLIPESVYELKLMAGRVFPLLAAPREGNEHFYVHEFEYKFNKRLSFRREHRYERDFFPTLKIEKRSRMHWN